MAVLSYRQALHDTLRAELSRDESVILLGEEIGVFEGSYKITAGLLAEFGPSRVRDTPIAEEGFVGATIGAAMLGMRPVVEIMTINFSLLAIDQGERAGPPLAAARAHRAHPCRTRTDGQPDRAWLDAVLRGVQPHRPVSAPAAHQRLPGALAPTEISTAAAIQEGQSLLATHHPPAAEAVHPLGMGSRILVINDDKSRMSREAHVRIRGSRGLKRPRLPARHSNSNSCTRGIRSGARLGREHRRVAVTYARLR